MAIASTYGQRQYDRIHANTMKAAKIEEESKKSGGLSGKMMGENTQKLYKFPRVFMSLAFKPIKKIDDELEDRIDLIVMSRCPALVCRNSYKDEYRFVLRGGPNTLRFLVRNHIFKSYEDFMERAPSNEYLNFLSKCFDIDPLLFELAKRNLDVEFDIPFNYRKYIELCGGETLFAEYNELADKIVRDADERREARKRK